MFGLYLLWVFPEPALICSVDFTSGRSFKIIKSYCSLVFHDNKSAQVTSETAVEMPEAAWHPFSSPALPLQPWLDLTGVQVCSGLVHTAKDQPTFTPVRVSKVAVTLEEIISNSRALAMSLACNMPSSVTITAPSQLQKDSGSFDD